MRRCSSTQPFAGSNQGRRRVDGHRYHRRQGDVISDFTADGVELGNVLRSEAFLAAIVRTGPGQRAIRFGADATSRAAAQDATVQPDDPEVREARLRGVATVCQTIATIRQR